MVSSIHHTELIHSDTIKPKRGVVMAIIKSQFTLRLDLKVHAKIKKIAEIESRSLTNMIEYLIKKEISDFESQNGELVLTDEDLSSK